MLAEVETNYGISMVITSFETINALIVLNYYRVPNYLSFQHVLDIILKETYQTKQSMSMWWWMISFILSIEVRTMSIIVNWQFMEILGL